MSRARAKALSSKQTASVCVIIFCSQLRLCPLPCCPPSGGWPRTCVLRRHALARRGRNTDGRNEHTAQTAAQKGADITIVANLGETIVFPVLVHPDSDTRVFRQQDEEELRYHRTGRGISEQDPSMEGQGVTRHRGNCTENTIRRQIECRYDVQWKSSQSQ